MSARAGDIARTWAFRALFYGLSVPVVLAAPVSALFGRPAVRAHARAWMRMYHRIARIVMGIEIRMEGTPPDRPVLFAAKHQAFLETFELTSRLGMPAPVMKEELSRIPVWGWTARRYGSIIVNRQASAAALRRMLREGKAIVAEGRSILIFPEGTRVRPGEQPPLQSGFAGLYKMLGLPVVPIALDSGRVWPRSGPMHPGIVTMRLGEMIPAGLPREEIEARVHAAINLLEMPATDGNPGV
ncbi:MULTISPECIES: lysophospholipid acyltransferase family protein [unclassified Sphingomonas]|uniref:lysophospholipid acyltransferase family protein n=1 Tax=unclassified Sphingomonas TaxID=196159 RepID=UPI0008364713|nr:MULTISPECIES: lysophospholipid acyltransferase family protein [unclassified Sphingomonas]